MPGNRAESCTDASTQPIRRRCVTELAVTPTKHQTNSTKFSTAFSLTVDSSGGKKSHFTFIAVLMEFPGKGFLWCRREQDSERLLHVWGFQGKIGHCGYSVQQVDFDYIQVNKCPPNHFILIHYISMKLWPTMMHTSCVCLSLRLSLQERPKPKIPILHYKAASTPLIICVKMVGRKRVCVLYVCCFWPPVPQVCNLS